MPGWKPPTLGSRHSQVGYRYKLSEMTLAKALEAARKCVELDPGFADGHYLPGLARDIQHSADIAPFARVIRARGGSSKAPFKFETRDL
jgi:hypothetical protein